MDSRELFLRAATGEATPRPPIWLMRQAGRYLPEYKSIRSKKSFAALCRDPSLSCEITLQPLRRFKLDAAIVFSDILLPAEALGYEFRLDEERGPVLSPPYRLEGDEKIWRPVEEALLRLTCVGKALQNVRAAQPSRALIGFAGAPLTVASYIIEGGSSDRMPHTFKMMTERPDVFARLMSALVDLTIRYVELQRAAGADAIQIFESWAGLIPEALYLEHAIPHLRHLLRSCYRPASPLILYAQASESLWRRLADLPVQVLSVNSEINMPRLAALRTDRALQGNLDPRWLLAPKQVLLAEAARIVAGMSGQGGFIFNVGRGLTPDVPPEGVRALVDWVAAL